MKCSFHFVIQQSPSKHYRCTASLSAEIRLAGERLFIQQTIYSGKPNILNYFILLKKSSGKIHHVHLHKYYQPVTNYQSTRRLTSKKLLIFSNTTTTISNLTNDLLQKKLYKHHKWGIVSLQRTVHSATPNEWNDITKMKNSNETIIILSPNAPTNCLVHLAPQSVTFLTISQARRDSHC